jgi:hypothetical protein
MELLLNLVWALITCGAFVFLLPRSRGGRAAVIGLACVAALLFPIISVSDDLSVARDAWEEATSIRRVSAMLDAFATSHSAAVPVAVLNVAVALLAIGLIESGIAPAIVRLLPAESDPRSPPQRNV